MGVTEEALDTYFAPPHVRSRVVSLVSRVSLVTSVVGIAAAPKTELTSMTTPHWTACVSCGVRVPPHTD